MCVFHPQLKSTAPKFFLPLVSSSTAVVLLALGLLSTSLIPRAEAHNWMLSPARASMQVIMLTCVTDKVSFHLCAGQYRGPLPRTTQIRHTCSSE